MATKDDLLDRVENWLERFYELVTDPKGKREDLLRQRVQGKYDTAYSLRYEPEWTADLKAEERRFTALDSELGLILPRLPQEISSLAPLMEACREGLQQHVSALTNLDSDQRALPVYEAAEAKLPELKAQLSEGAILYVECPLCAHTFEPKSQKLETHFYMHHKPPGPDDCIHIDSDEHIRRDKAARKTNVKLIEEALSGITQLPAEKTDENRPTVGLFSEARIETSVESTSASVAQVGDEVPTFTCPQCRGWTRDENLLKRHIAAECTGYVKKCARPECGKIFQATRSTHIYCSRSCADKAKYARKYELDEN